MPRRTMNEIDGLLLVDKPMDWTSHDVVNCIRSRFNLSKTGHCGTLDPIATGLLVLLLGHATKLQDRLMSEDKVYTGTMRLGVETDSEDRTGVVTATADASGVTPEQVRTIAARFLGPQQQTPPMVSAIKKDGKPLYKLARKGEVIERESRPIVIHALELSRIALPDVDFCVHCSKGTYIRTLCADMGRALGCGAHMLELRRESSGSFQVADAVNMDAIKSWELPEFVQHVQPLGDVIAKLLADKEHA
ncbi:tRNA pseudouridine(55) synthase TruB [Oligosphaera ethanolica]|uniref:tRNA pseudouridine synthase B n=1 Tax=Oligosphaera ethanolica TaxID=760260 RepID=A0AAE3VH75_9BACT|nr:tRNA pseudouridine(55) synthase TruB [Oligosphaera ethanolica]MDQ0290489.1 tRNA pseudouridine55 synthase [Oligosphaera ethanolica]NLE53488.1 tRNA pseudouridine(55) synthase TruB [Lentisphaerota bacterium]